MALVYSCHKKHSKLCSLEIQDAASLEIRDPVGELCGVPRRSSVVIFTCKRKLIKNRLVDGLKVVTFYLALNRQEIYWLSLDG